MTIQVVRLAKTSKTFHRNNFRRVIILLIISLALNALFAFGIYSQFISKKVPTFYSTSGITPPIKLDPLPEPNYSSKPLLEEDKVMINGDTIVTYGQE